MRFVLATSNKHKIDEFRALLSPHDLYVVGNLDAEESKDTYEGNSLIKLDALVDHMFVERDGVVSDEVCFADDSGIEIEAFDGKPGVFSSRFMPGVAQDERNRIIVRKVAETGRNGAVFVSCISFFAGGKEIKRQVISRCEGTILSDEGAIVRTERDFGYDPIFIPKGFDRPFNVLSKDVKNSISHRALAVKGMLAALSDMHLI